MDLNRANYSCKTAPERIIQFGEGNFLRAFVDWMIEEMNQTTDFNSNVVVVQPINNGMVNVLNQQDGLFSLVSKGLKNGEPVKESKIISSISRGINPYSHFEDYLKLAENPDMRFIISNTTEAGIAFNENDTREMQPPSSFPAKLTVLLYHRFKHFNGDKTKGFIILPCELIDRNGDKLKKYVAKYCDLWKLESSFRNWLETANIFTNTLVDRIVPGFNPETAAKVNKKTGYDDKLVVDSEQFHLWVIEGPQSIKSEIPAEKANLNVLFVDDVTPYRTRKVRLLNGPHTVMAPVASLCGIEHVDEALDHEIVGQFIRQTINNEIIPALNINKKELEEFANEVINRFRNPFIKHALLSISLNSVSKFKARVLDTIKEYKSKKDQLPVNLTISLSALMAFYRGKIDGKKILLKDEDYILSFFNTNWDKVDAEEISLHDFVYKFLSSKMIWGEDLSQIDGLVDTTTHYLDDIMHKGMLEVLKSIIPIEV